MSNMKPEIRFGEFADAWEKRKLGSITESFSGGTPSSGNSEYYGGSIPFIRSGEISLNITELFVTEAGLNNSSAKMVKEGDILYALYGATSGEVSISKINGAINQAILAIRSINNDDHYLIAQWLRMQKKRIISTYLQGGQGNLSGSIVKELEITLPINKDEQKLISSLFYTLDNLITLHQRKLDKMKNLKSAYLSKMFPKEGERYPRLRFAGFTDVWEQRKLGDLGKTFTGLSGKTKNDFGHGDAEFVTYMNVFSNPISNTDQTENVEIDDRQNEVEYGDIFFTTSSETPEEVGMSSVWLGNKPNVYLNSFCFGYRPTEKLDPYYMAYMLRSPEVRKKFLFLAQGISRYNISKTKVMDLFVPIPKIEEQMVIGKFLNNLDNLVNLHQRKLEKLEQFKQAMLKKMFV